jgi:hypothetical protein
MAGSVSANNEWVFTHDNGGGNSSLRSINPFGVQRTLTPENVNVGGVPAAYWSPDVTSVAWNVAGRVGSW